MSDVVVSGTGVVSSLGCSTQEAFGAALRGACGVTAEGKDEEGRLLGFPTAPVDDLSVPHLTEREWKTYDRSVLFSLSAVRQAWHEAGSPAVRPDRLAVCLASGLGGHTSTAAAMERYWRSDGKNVLASTIPRIMPNAPAAVAAIELGAQGGCYTMVSACASGADCVAQGWRLIASGEVDVAVVGGCEAPLHPTSIRAFGALRALSTNTAQPHLASRPFDRHRDGFVMAEGAAVLVLERGEYARARGADPLARLHSAAVTSDAHHLVAPAPNGDLAAKCLLRTLKIAGLGPDDVAAVSAHATGTPVGDAAEARALATVFGRSVGGIPVTALKSMTGHMIGGAGAIAGVMATQCLAEAVVTPTPNFTAGDAGFPLNIVGPEARPMPSRGAGVMVVNSFGFGGQNVSYCLGLP